jgi:hypothetical protein
MQSARSTTGDAPMIASSRVGSSRAQLAVLTIEGRPDIADGLAEDCLAASSWCDATGLGVAESARQ